MAKLKFTKKIDLSYVGEEWKDCFIEFNVPSFSEYKKIAEATEKGNNDDIMDASIKVIENHFVSGKGVDMEGKVIDLKSEDIKEFPIELVVKIIREFSGQPNPN